MVCILPIEESQDCTLITAAHRQRTPNFDEVSLGLQAVESRLGDETARDARRILKIIHHLQ